MKMTVAFAEEFSARTVNSLLIQNGCESRLTQQSHIWLTSAKDVHDIVLSLTMIVVATILAIRLARFAHIVAQRLFCESISAHTAKAVGVTRFATNNEFHQWHVCSENWKRLSQDYAAFQAAHLVATSLRSRTHIASFTNF